MKHFPVIVVSVTAIILSFALLVGRPPVSLKNPELLLEDRIEIHENVLIELNNRIKKLEGNP